MESKCDTNNELKHKQVIKKKRKGHNNNKKRFITFLIMAILSIVIIAINIHMNKDSNK